jgi:hypothetical protein
MCNGKKVPAARYLRFLNAGGVMAEDVRAGKLLRASSLCLINHPFAEATMKLSTITSQANRYGYPRYLLSPFVHTGYTLTWTANLASRLPTSYACIDAASQPLKAEPGIPFLNAATSLWMPL